MLKFHADSIFLVVISFLIPNILTHSFILSLNGNNGVRSTGFGTRLTLRGRLEQNTGIIKDEEISSGSVGPCGRIFGGDSMEPFNIDPQYELTLSEKSGIPTVDEKSGIRMGVFVHNPDGAGPFYCDYSPDESLKDFHPMNVTVQIEGDQGVNSASENFVYPLNAAFFPNTTCTGGKGKDTCVMRCRNPLGFGSCAAVKLDPSLIPDQSLTRRGFGLNSDATQNKIFHPLRRQLLKGEAHRLV